MSHEHAFLADISEHPDDDTPRLVYADWLEDHGETEADRARAEFIRVQCQLANLAEHALVRRAHLEAREAELLRQHGKAWSAPFRKYGQSFSFRRGFTDRITLRADVFMKHADDIAKLTPLCDVKLRESKDVVEALASCRHLQKLRSLNLDFNKLGVNRLRTLLASKRLKNLRALDLSNNSLSSGAGDVLTGAKCLANLTDLTLNNNRLGEAGFAALARAPWLKRLRSLRLVNTGLQAGSLSALLDGLTGGELRHLDLCENPELGSRGLEVLAASPGVGNLTTLILQFLAQPRWSGEGPTPGGQELHALARSPHLKNLASLDLGNNGWVGPSLGGLAGAPPLPALRSLDLSSVGLGDSRTRRRNLEGFEAFVGSDFVRGLRSLVLSRNPVESPRLVEALSRSRTLTSLETLRLARGACRDAGAWKALAHLDLPSLAHLDLSTNALGNTGASAIARCPALARLQTLSLASNRIGDKGMTALTRSPHLESLAALDLRTNPAKGKAARARLAERFGERVLL